MDLKLSKHFYSIFFSLILIFSMNFRGYAGYIAYLEKIEKSCCAVDHEDKDDDDNNLYTNTNSSEENENQGSNSFEILEKLNLQTKYNLLSEDLSSESRQQIYYHLDLYSLLKASLNTPPPEFV